MAGDAGPEIRLTCEEREAEALRRSGLVIVSGDEATVLGWNVVLPWRHRYKRPMPGVKKEEPSDNAGEGMGGQKIRSRPCGG